MSTRTSRFMRLLVRCLATPLHCLLLLLVLAIPGVAVASGPSAESRGEQEESRTIVAEGCPTCVRRHAAPCIEMTSSVCLGLLDGNHRPKEMRAEDHSVLVDSPYAQSNPPRLF